MKTFKLVITYMFGDTIVGAYPHISILVLGKVCYQIIRQTFGLIRAGIDFDQLIMIS